MAPGLRRSVQTPRWRAWIADYTGAVIKLPDLTTHPLQPHKNPSARRDGKIKQYWRIQVKKKLIESFRTFWVKSGEFSWDINTKCFKLLSGFTYVDIKGCGCTFVWGEGAVKRIFASKISMEAVFKPTIKFAEPPYSPKSKLGSGQFLYPLKWVFICFS